MYYRHFGLDGAPFQFAPVARDLYLSAAHREGLAALEWGVLHEPSGFTLLIGETGTGKTTLIKAILAREYPQVHIACISNAKFDSQEMLREVVSQFGLSVAPQKYEMLAALDTFLNTLQRGERAVVVLDEAQDADDGTLEELRLLSNRSQGEDKRLHFVLVGQPELLRRMMEPELRQLNERIGARAMLLQLTPEEAFGYLEFRLRACGGSTSRVFEPNAAHHIIEHSGGIPRRINVLAHNALLLAYSANIARVDLKSARAAVAEFTNLLTTKRRRFTAEQPGRLWLRLSIAAAALAILGLLVFALGPGGVWPRINPRHSDDIKLKPFDFSKIGSFVKQSVASSSPRPAAELPTLQVIEQHNNAVDGPAIFPAAMAAVSSQTSRRTNGREIRVHSGDTLEHIAIEYLGSEGALQNLIAANPQVRNVNLIYPGEIVHLPVESDAQE
jgi:general secretion pathway protein A